MKFRIIASELLTWTFEVDAPSRERAEELVRDNASEHLEAPEGLRLINSDGDFQINDVVEA